MQEDVSDRPRPERQEGEAKEQGSRTTPKQFVKRSMYAAQAERGRKRTRRKRGHLHWRASERYVMRGYV